MKRILRTRGANRAGQVALASLVVFVVGLALLPHRLTARNNDVNITAIPVVLLLAGLMVPAASVATPGFFHAD